jgi:hypothetical protein
MLLLLIRKRARSRLGAWWIRQRHFWGKSRLVGRVATREHVERGMILTEGAPLMVPERGTDFLMISPRHGHVFALCRLGWGGVIGVNGS